MTRSTIRTSILSLAAAVFLVAGSVGCASSGGSDKSDNKQASSSTQTAAEGDESTASSTNEREQAQPPAGTSQPGSTGQQQEKITKDQLAQFADISKQLEKIQMDAQKKMQQAESREEAKQIQMDAQNKAKAIFQDEEMTRDEFRMIGKRLKSDPALQQRLQAVVREQQK